MWIMCAKYVYDIWRYLINDVLGKGGEGDPQFMVSEQARKSEWTMEYVWQYLVELHVANMNEMNVWLAIMIQLNCFCTMHWLRFGGVILLIIEIIYVQKIIKSEMIGDWLNGCSIKNIKGETIRVTIHFFFELFFFLLHLTSSNGVY